MGMAAAAPTVVLEPSADADADAARVRQALAGEPVGFTATGDAHGAVAWAPASGPSALAPLVRRLRERARVGWVIGVLAAADGTSSVARSRPAWTPR